MCRVLQQQSRGQLDQALQTLLHMRKPPSSSTYISLLRECKQDRSLDQAKQIQAHLAHHNISLRGLLGDYLVMTLASCGAHDDALHVSYTLPCRTVYSGTAIISAFVDCRRPFDALRVYQYMLDDHIEPDRYTFVSLLKACGSIPDLASGRKFHAQAVQVGIALDMFVGNSLVSMYGNCGEVFEAEKVFYEMPLHTTVSWNSMMSAYLVDGQGELALQLYSQMHTRGGSYDHATSVLALQACSTLVEENNFCADRQLTGFLPLNIGRALHADLRRTGFASQIFIASTLVRLYGKV
ncbi:hypothetical protein L7F22_022626 [Adiantum nelumboides]|nr:hypothetical protein [Adiantum nelumboides]